MSLDKIPQFLYLQLFLTARLPLENQEDIYFGYFFEVVYPIPVYPLKLFTEREVSRTYRATDRRGTYVMVENMFQK
jgi:hypothetical protein